MHPTLVHRPAHHPGWIYEERWTGTVCSPTRTVSRREGVGRAENRGSVNWAFVPPMPHPTS